MAEKHQAQKEGKYDMEKGIKKRLTNFTFVNRVNPSSNYFIKQIANTGILILIY